MKYSLEIVWPNQDAATREDTTRFLSIHAFLPLDEAIKRAGQVLILARDAESQVVATCTAFPILIESLDVRCFYYRTFVVPAHRSVGLASGQLAKRLLVDSYHFLNDRFSQGHDPDVIGLYLEIENPRVQRIRNEAVWQSDGLNVVYIGKSQSGKHCRICYFDRARITGS